MNESNPLLENSIDLTATVESVKAIFQNFLRDFGLGHHNSDFAVRLVGSRALGRGESNSDIDVLIVISPSLWDEIVEESNNTLETMRRLLIIQANPWLAQTSKLDQFQFYMHAVDNKSKLVDVHLLITDTTLLDRFKNRRIVRK